MPSTVFKNKFDQLIKEKNWYVRTISPKGDPNTGSTIHYYNVNATIGAKPWWLVEEKEHGKDAYGRRMTVIRICFYGRGEAYNQEQVESVLSDLLDLFGHGLLSKKELDNLENA